jgi:selenide,water dikinase
MGPEDLEQVLLPLQKIHNPALLIGLAVKDDAAVYQISETQAMVQTVDFFPPVVDDPYYYGAIAAANSMSDVYAMGGEVTMGLNIAGFPENLPISILSEIFRGGAEKMAEVGAVIAGGHTVTDKEPKYGICVTGFVDPRKVLTKAAAKAGDKVYLTKPLGTGIITTAGKRDVISAEHLDTAIESMAKLNRQASQLAQKVGVHACTDITGFGILGHSYEVAKSSGVGLRLWLEKMPLLPGAWDYAEQGCLPGGVGRNRAYLMGTAEKDGIGQYVHLVNKHPHTLEDLVFDPETSGGLLITIASDKASELEAAFAQANHPLWYIGEAFATGKPYIEAV